MKVLIMSAFGTPKAKLLSICIVMYLSEKRLEKAVTKLNSEEVSVGLLVCKKDAAKQNLEMLQPGYFGNSGN
jgi:hypothetical protein